MKLWLAQIWSTWTLSMSLYDYNIFLYTCIRLYDKCTYNINVIWFQSRNFNNIKIVQTNCVSYKIYKIEFTYLRSRGEELEILIFWIHYWSRVKITYFDKITRFIFYVQCTYNTIPYNFILHGISHTILIIVYIHIFILKLYFISAIT